MEENQKMSKIIEQFSFYLLENGIQDFSVEFKKTNKYISFIFVCKELKKERLNTLQQTFKTKRQAAFEYYGWELIGHGKSQRDLALLSTLIDYFTYYLRDGKVHFNLVRYERI